MQTKRLKQADGTIVHYVVIDGKTLTHNYDGPALIPQGDKRKAEYYVFGVKKTKEQWENIKKDGEGVPFYKTSVGKSSGARV
jgi:hypothetical protein